MDAPAQLRSDSGSSPSARRLWWAVLLAAAVLYAATCQRGVSWQDSGMYQYRAAALDLRGHLGLALAHPLYIIAGWLLKFVPIASFPARLNFFSGLGMAVACANIAAVCLLLTGRRWIAAAAAGMIALAHTPWWLATVAEVYTWSLAGFTAELWLLVALLRRPGAGKLIALALVSGLGLCIHNFALLPLPVYLAVAIVLLLRRRLPAWSLAAAAGAYVLAAGLYLALIVAELAGGAGVGEAIGSALFGAGYQGRVLNAALEWGAVRKANMLLMLINVLGPQLLFVVGAWVLRRRAGGGVAAALLALAGIHLLFVLRYDVPDQFTFFLPSLAMLTVLAAVGLAEIARMGKVAERVAAAVVAVWLVAAPMAYAAAPGIARRAGVEIARPRELPGRDEGRYWLVPWKHDEPSAANFAADCLSGAQAVPDGAFILADATAYYPLAAARRVGGLRGDVTLLGGHEPWPVPHPNDDLEAFLSAVGDRPVYVVSRVEPYCPKSLTDRARFDFERAGSLYLLKRRPGAKEND
jgi:hypothetical protein